MNILDDDESAMTEDLYSVSIGIGATPGGISNMSMTPAPLETPSRTPARNMQQETEDDYDNHKPTTTMSNSLHATPKRYSPTTFGNGSTRSKKGSTARFRKHDQQLAAASGNQSVDFLSHSTMVARHDKKNNQKKEHHIVSRWNNMLIQALLPKILNATTRQDGPGQTSQNLWLSGSSCTIGGEGTSGAGKRILLSQSQLWPDDPTKFKLMRASPLGLPYALPRVCSFPSLSLGFSSGAAGGNMDNNIKSLGFDRSSLSANSISNSSLNALPRKAFVEIHRLQTNFGDRGSLLSLLVRENRLLEACHFVLTESVPRRLFVEIVALHCLQTKQLHTLQRFLLTALAAYQIQNGSKPGQGTAITGPDVGGGSKKGNAKPAISTTTDHIKSGNLQYSHLAYLVHPLSAIRDLKLHLVKHPVPPSVPIYVDDLKEFLRQRRALDLLYRHHLFIRDQTNCGLLSIQLFVHCESWDARVGHLQNSLEHLTTAVHEFVKMNKKRKVNNNSSHNRDSNSANVNNSSSAQPLNLPTQTTTTTVALESNLKTSGDVSSHDIDYFTGKSKTASKSHPLEKGSEDFTDSGRTDGGDMFAIEKKSTSMEAQQHTDLSNVKQNSNQATAIVKKNPDNNNKFNFTAIDILTQKEVTEASLRRTVTLVKFQVQVCECIPRAELSSHLFENYLYESSKHNNHRSREHDTISRRCEVVERLLANGHFGLAQNIIEFLNLPVVEVCVRASNELATAEARKRDGSITPLLKFLVAAKKTILGNKFSKDNNYNSSESIFNSSNSTSTTLRMSGMMQAQKDQMIGLASTATRMATDLFSSSLVPQRQSKTKKKRSGKYDVLDANMLSGSSFAASERQVQWDSLVSNMINIWIIEKKALGESYDAAREMVHFIIDERCMLDAYVLLGYLEQAFTIAKQIGSLQEVMGLKEIVSENNPELLKQINAYLAYTSR